MEEVCGFV